MTSGFYNYLQLIGNNTSYAKRMARLSNQIFGNVVRPLAKPSHRKVAKILSVCPRNTNPAIVNYYPRHIETHFLMKNLRDYGLFRDEHQDFREEMRRLNALRGKADKIREKRPRKSDQEKTVKPVA